MAPRRKSSIVQQVGLGLVVGLIVLAFVLVFGQPQSGGGPGVVAEVDGERVSREAFEFFRAQVAQTQGPLLAGGNDRLVQQQIDLLAREQLVQRYVMAQEARELGLRVSDQEIWQEFCRDSNFWQDGRCDADLIRNFITRSFGSEAAYTDEVRRDLLNRKLRRTVASPIRVSDAAVEETLRRDRLELRLRYVSLRGSDFLEGLEVGDAEAAELAAAEPERLGAAYERRIGEFQQPERIRGRHILFSGEDALARAEEARRRIDAGEDFVVLATQLSDDEATRETGGDLGFFPRGRMLPGFEEAAFAADERTLVGPVETERGQHLIRVEEREPAVDRSLAEVSLELARELIRADRAREAARTAAERMADLLRQGTPFEEAAGVQGLEVDQTPFFRLQETLVPGIGRVAGLREVAGSLTAESPDSARVLGSQDVFYLISLADRREPDADALAAEREPLRERMLAQARDRVLSEWYRDRRRRLEDEERLLLYPLDGS